MVCAWCWPELFELAPPRCFACGVDSPDAKVCAACREGRPGKPAIPLNHVWVVTPYRGGAKALVRRMKIDAQRQACLLIARAMHESVPQFSGVCVTSVPTSTARIRERGFDHSRLIAREFARLQGLPHRPLLWRRGRSKQAGATKAQRAEQIRGAYQVRRGRVGDLKDIDILLIDDVTTTGATLIEVASVLRQAGAQNVSALVFAQTSQ